MNKCKFLLGVTLLLALFFSGCPDPLTPGETPANAAPANMGYFSLSIGGGGASRTIMPVMPEPQNLYYKLEFYQSGTTTNPKTVGPVSKANLSNPVLLEVGTYDLEVSAYKDEAGTQKTAQSEKTAIIITSGETTTSSVYLKPITDIGSGQGTFKWTISYPDDVSIASMTIAKTPGGTGSTYYFKGGTPSIGTDSSMSTMDTGYYIVTFNLTLGGKKLERKEILHIYQNLESYFPYTFTEKNFFAQMTDITIDPSSKIIYAIGEKLALNIYAVYDVGLPSLILDAYTSNYNPDTAGEQNLTITHTNTGFTKTITVTVLEKAARIPSMGGKEYPTLNAAINDAVNGTADTPTEIVILRDITAPEAGMTANTGYTIPANKNIKLTVESNQSRTITASAGDFALFTVNAGTTLTLSGTNGSLTLDGKKATAQDNRRGINVNGGIFTMNSNVTITNFGNSYSDSTVGGGGVYVNSGTFTMNGGEISGNTAIRGGGVYSLGTFTMNSGEISGNTTASSNGGGVYVGSNGTFTMKGGEISNNNSSSTGGGVYSLGTFTMISGKISDNTASSTGGGVYVYTGATFTMSDGEISGNTASSNGGGVHVYTGATFTMSDGEISGNIANSSGGGVYLNTSGTFTMEGGEISDNTAINSSGNGGGGGVYVGTDGKFTMDDGKISGNTANTSGGGVAIAGAFTMSNGEISGNKANNNGGGVLVGFNNSINSAFTMSGGKISGNTASSNGGGVYVGTATFTMSGGTIYGTNEPNTSLRNSATSGASVYSSGTANYSGAYAGKGYGSGASGNNITTTNNTLPPTMVTGVTLNKNSISLTVGATETLTATVAPTNATNKTVSWSSSNTAVAAVDASGKVTAVTAGTATITVTTADGNKTATCAVTVTEAEARIGSTGYATLTDALAAAPAGTTVDTPTEIIILRDIIAVQNGTNNYAYIIPASRNIKLNVEAGKNITITASEGGFRLFSVSNASSSLTLGSTSGGGTLTLSGNNEDTQKYRQGVNVDGSGRSLTMNKGVTITGFKNSSDGGGVFVSGYGTFTMNEGTIKNNNVTNDSNSSVGGGVYVQNGTFTMNGGEISGNNALSRGGGVFLASSGNSTMNGGKISDNTSNNGGGISVEGPTFIMSGGEITGNNTTGATSSGGGVYISGGTFTIDGGEITSNTSSYQGGGVYVSGGTVNMLSGTITGNKTTSATSRGGGVYVSSGTYNMSGGEITGNTSSNQGGGVYVNSSATFTMSGGTIYGIDDPAKTNTVNGSAATKGVALYNNGGTANYSGSYGPAAITTTDNTIPPKSVPVTSVSLNKTALTLLAIGGTETLIATVAPTNATNKTVSWSSSNTAVAAVDANGKVTAVTAGTATITVTADGNKTATCTVTVQAPAVSMVQIPAGTFTMGSPTTESNRQTDETQHSVTLSGFSMSKYQVTQAQYRAVMGAGEDETTDMYGKGDNYPVYYVNWYKAIVFCNKLSMAEGLDPVYSIGGKINPAEWGTIPTSSNATWNAVVMDRSKNGYRLPTEAEWEYACRAGTTTAYNTGNTISDDTGWYSNNSGSKTHEVGLKPANAWGLYDMHGNVYEWCWDWYGSYSTGSQTDPDGALSGSGRVRRGGNCTTYGQILRSAYRGNTDPSERGYILGLRLVRSGE